jgi:hypothetical protein
MINVIIRPNTLKLNLAICRKNNDVEQKSSVISCDVKELVKHRHCPENFKPKSFPNTKTAWYTSLKKWTQLMIPSKDIRDAFRGQTCVSKYSMLRPLPCATKTAIYYGVGLLMPQSHPTFRGNINRCEADINHCPPHCGLQLHQPRPQSNPIQLIKHWYKMTDKF